VFKRALSPPAFTLQEDPCSRYLQQRWRPTTSRSVPVPPGSTLQSTPPQRFPGRADRDCSPSARRRPLPSRQHPQPSAEQKYLVSPHMANHQESRQRHRKAGKTADKKTSAGLTSARGTTPGTDAQRLPALTHRHGFVRTRGSGGLGSSPDRAPALPNFRGTMKSLSRVLLPTPVTSRSVTMGMPVMLQRKGKGAVE